jgi:hypothetical protein
MRSAAGVDAEPYAQTPIGTRDERVLFERRAASDAKVQSGNADRYQPLHATTFQ